MASATMRRYDPWREMARMFEDFDRLFGNGAPRTALGQPRLNCWLKDDAMMVTVELPGVDPEQVDITLQQDTLTISGQFPSRERRDNESYYRNERRGAAFQRVVNLPFAVEREKVEANFRNGVLAVHLPRAEEDKPRKITVNAG